MLAQVSSRFDTVRDRERTIFPLIPFIPDSPFCEGFLSGIQMQSRFIQCCDFRLNIFPYCAVTIRRNCFENQNRFTIKINWPVQRIAMRLASGFESVKFILE